MGDKFPTLAALKGSVAASDYRIRCLDRKSRITIISPHGGYIEPGTSAIARAIAGRKHNLFDFQGLRKENPKELHVTSTRFRDPLLTGMLESSDAAVSVHGMGNQDKPMIWLGGRNAQLKGLILNLLKQQGFEVNPNGPRYRGESPQNVVNLAGSEGVQLEISDELINQLFHGPAFRRDRRRLVTRERFAALVSSVRQAVDLYLLHFAQDD